MIWTVCLVFLYYVSLSNCISTFVPLWMGFSVCCVNPPHHTPYHNIAEEEVITKWGKIIEGEGRKLRKLVIRGPTEQERISERCEGKFRKASWQAFLSLYWRVFMGLQCVIMSGGWRHRVSVCSSHQFLSSSPVTPARGGFILFSVTPPFGFCTRILTSSSHH
jgi:hypothetical protein